MDLQSQDWNKVKKQRKKTGRKKEELKEVLDTKKKSPDGRFVARAYRAAGVSQEQWMNYLTNLTYTYNSSTTPWGFKEG